MSFVAGKFTCVHLWLFVVLLRLGWGQDFFYNSQIDGVNLSTRGSHVIPYTRIPRATSAVKRTCLAPQQPGNGKWRLQQDFCEEGGADCEVPEGTELGLGYQLIYSCTTGYKIVGNHNVFCRGGGTWSPIPACEEIRCYPLNTVSRIAQCSRFGVSVDCDLPAPPKTRAEATCRPGYEKDASLLTPRRNVLNCNDDGNWRPQPVRCSPVCGLEVTHQTPFVAGGSDADIADFPWHATLYEERSLSEGTTKDFKCGATIIQANLLMTAAHCVYDENIRATIDAKKLFILTGNTLRDYDHPMHDFDIVRKGAVKRVYVSINYYGLRGNYAADIALLELQEPFLYSGILIPACLDTSGYSAPVLESGISGRIAGFGRTATGDSSLVLQTITVPYIPYRECKASSNSMKNHVFITSDKFCAGYTDGRAVCEGDSGGGLVFRKNDRWYVMGIVSVGLGVDTDNGERQCDKYAYTLYTRVSDHAEWILEIISDLEPSKSRPTWNFNLSDRQTPTSSVTPSLAENSSVSPALTLPAPTPSCLSPSQPTNGQWKLHSTQCNDKNCDLSQGVKLEPGSRLVYTCDPGYKLKGNTDVFCGRGGIWSSSPSCIETKCSPLNFVATTATCVAPPGDETICDSPVSPGTRATLTCRPGYTKERTFVPSLQSETVECNANGEWEPNPIMCTPVCGQAIAHQTPFVVNGKAAKLGDFPWHATIYMERNAGMKKELRCGATIIAANLLLTAAHCVYDEATRTTSDPRKLLVVTGNLFRDYDFPSHDPQIVKKSMVNNVHINCQYHALAGNYAADIALLELKDPFPLSNILLPACLDSFGYSKLLLEPGANGKFAGFGRTATGPSSGILQTITVPYISTSQCKAERYTAGGYRFITNDTFCAGYSNGSAICEGDGGGGLVFKKNDLWYVLGIASVGLGANFENGKKTCDRYSYGLYTRVSNYIEWIQNVMFELARHNSYPPCKAKA